MNLSIKELNELIYSLGTTASKGMLCDKELNASLLDKLYAELNYKLQIKSNITDEVIDRVKSHYVSNEEADENASTSVIDDYRIHLRKLKTRGYTSQALLDYVDSKGAVSHKELERYYKQITGSNSFSHILQNLRIPYKNRKTQRYLAKEGKRYSDAKYVIKVANPSNWVVVNY
jgi:hypothetical protein